MKTMRIINLTIAGCIILFTACSPSKENKLAKLEEAAEEIRKTTVPDRRLGVFQFNKDEDGNITSFETDHPTAARSVDSLLKAYSYVEIPVITLPDPSLGDSLYAIVRVGVANLRGQPRHGAELVDQVVMGSPLRILKRQGNWIYIQTSYRYLGWMTPESVIITDATGFKAWENKPKVQVQNTSSNMYEKMDFSSLRLSDLSMNAIVAFRADRGSWSEIELADGRVGYIPSSDIGIPTIIDQKVPDGWQITRTALRFHGIPYLWGGNSSRGFDCSGYTQTVYAANGYQLPRDANMQVELGVDVPFDSTFGNVLPGDLLFFGENDRITHVGISLGGPQFIHASTYVMMNSLDPSDEDYTAYRRNTLKRIKRLQTNQENL
jgi:hypothetical protein